MEHHAHNPTSHSGHAQGPDTQHPSHSDHTHHHAHMILDFKKRFWISLALTIPVLLLSHMIREIVGLHFAVPFENYILFALSSFIFVYGGRPFLSGLVSEIKDKKPGMMTLIGVAITVAYVYSSFIVFGLQGMDFFWELATLIDIMLLGHWIEMRSMEGASGALQLLVQLLPSSAHLLHGDHVMDVKTDALKPGDVVLIKPGEKIPADGVILEGESYLNESMLTGESKPALRITSDKVISGAINGNGSLKVKVERIGKDSYLARVIDLVRGAQQAKSATQKLADKAAFWLTIFALSGGAITLVAWIIMGSDVSFALERMVTVMVISCPHALGLAIPLVASISTTLAAKKGLLIRNRTAFENARKITIVIFDKTGTLTEGKFGVSRVLSLNKDFDENKILFYAATLEQNSEHPIAAGILAETKKKNISLGKVEKFRALTGEGISGMIDEKEILLVSPGYLSHHKIAGAENFSGDESTTVFLLVNKQLAGAVSLADKIRPESSEAIKLLHQHHIKTIMLTGDNAKVAAAVSKELGLDTFHAELLPHQKLEKIKALQQQGEFVAMTGDGVNDTPALAQADIGIAVGSGTDIAGATADIILVESNPEDIASLILFGRATYKKMIQNLIWATAYNAITLPLATGFIAGVTITPAMGALFMSLSTIVVAINAQTLRLKR